MKFLTTILVNLALLAASLVPQSCSAQNTGAAISGQVITPTGTPAYNAAVRVCAITAVGVPCNPTASLFSDISLSQSIPNPVSTDQYGNYKFFLAPNTYAVQVTLAGFAQPTYIYYVSAGTGSTTSSSFTPVGETPSGAIDGTNTVFTLSHTPVTGSLTFQYNGQILTQGIGYTLAGATVTLAIAPVSPDQLFANYYENITTTTTYTPVSETPSGAVNGINQVFTLSHAPATGSLLFQLNGQVLYSGVRYNISGLTVTTTFAPRTGDNLYAIYVY